MFNVGGGELLVIMLLALIILGPQRLPTAARTVGRVMGDLRRISSGFQQELKDAFDDGESPTPLRRKESVPLESTVAEADKAGAKELNPSRADDGSTSDSAAVAPRADGGPAPSAARATADDVGSAPVTAEDDDEAADTTVAPAVAAALDEIVTPIEPSAGPPPAAPADAAEGRGDDAVGDQRAAS